MAGRKGMRQKDSSDTARLRAWGSMRIFGVFTTREVASTAEISMENLWKYLRLLKTHGYIEDIGSVEKPTQPGYTRKYELIMDTGPKPPLPFGKNGLRDLNTGDIYQTEE